MHVTCRKRHYIIKENRVTGTYPLHLYRRKRNTIPEKMDVSNSHSHKKTLETQNGRRTDTRFATSRFTGEKGF